MLRHAPAPQQPPSPSWLARAANGGGTRSHRRALPASRRACVGIVRIAIRIIPLIPSRTCRRAHGATDYDLACYGRSSTARLAKYRATASSARSMRRRMSSGMPCLNRLMAMPSWLKRGANPARRLLRYAAEQENGLLATRGREFLTRRWRVSDGP